MKKILYSYIIIFVIFIFAGTLLAQKTNCFEVKHLNFFGIEEDSKINWSDEELDKLLETKFEDNTYWMIPPTVFQLRSFHPNCNAEIDRKRFDKLTLLYFTIRKKDNSGWKNKTIDVQLDFIREDFYSLLNDENILPFLRYTMDDGPLYGEIPKAVPNWQKGKSILTEFGKIAIVKSKNKFFLIAADKQNKVIWSRIMTGTVPKRYLQNLEFYENPLQETPFATVIYLHTSERLTIYLKPDGKFICYFHSW